MKPIVTITGSILTGLSAVIASSCCAIPLLLFSSGITGAWVSNLSELQPFRYLLISLSITLLFAGVYSYLKKRKARCCSKKGKVIKISTLVFIVISVLLIGTAIFWDELKGDFYISYLKLKLGIL